MTKNKDAIETLTKKKLGILRAANRSCGLSYRSACNRGIDIAKELHNEGFLTLYDNGRNLGQFVFRTTETGKRIIKAVSDGSLL